jgi:metal-dependent amidase/aminoacylase/carboxypeptidase family protein
VLASQLVTALQSVASRNVNTLDSVVLSVTRIAGGNTWNVLPESVELEGTLRTHRTEVQQNVKARVGEIASGFARAFSAQIDITWYAGPDALVNDERWAEFATSVARDAGYETRHAELHMGGKISRSICSRYQGICPYWQRQPFGLHHPAFNPDEALIEPAARYFAQLAEKALHQI